MTTREEMIELDPDEYFGVSLFTVYVDDNETKAHEKNELFRAEGSRKRARIIVCEETVVAEGEWTPEEAEDVADGLVSEQNSDFIDPQKGFWHLWFKIASLFQKKSE